MLALAGALERQTRVDVEQECQVGAERQGLEIVQGVDQVERDAAAVPLVREGRVLEAIAQHEAAGVEGGTDDLVDVLGAGRGVQKELADRRHDGIPGVEDEPADLVAYRRAARLPGQDVIDPSVLEGVRQKLDLRRLAGSFDSLEGDEVDRTGARCHRLRDGQTS